MGSVLLPMNDLLALIEIAPSLTGHYSNVIMTAIASQITGVSIVWSIVCSGVGQRKHESSVSLTFVKGIHRWPVGSSHKGPVTRKMFSFDDVIMYCEQVLVYMGWLISETCNDANFDVAGGIIGYRYDNIRCYLLRQRWQASRWIPVSSTGISVSKLKK